MPCLNLTELSNMFVSEFASTKEGESVKLLACFQLPLIRRRPREVSVTLAHVSVIGRVDA